MSTGEGAVLFLVIAIVVAWAYHHFRRWFFASPKRLSAYYDPREPEPEGDVPDLLREAGYRVLSGKRKIPVTITLDEEETLASRYFIDYLAKRGDEWYVVKTAKSRQPVEWTGSGVRDRLLPYMLLFGDEIEGLLYVDPEQGVIRKITFEIE